MPPCGSAGAVGFNIGTAWFVLRLGPETATCAVITCKYSEFYDKVKCKHQ